MKIETFLVLFNAAALLTSYAVGNGFLILFCIFSFIMALIALVRRWERERRA